MPSTWLSVCLGVRGRGLERWRGMTNVGDGAVEGGFGTSVFGAEEAVHDGEGSVVGTDPVEALLLEISQPRKHEVSNASAYCNH